MNGVDLRFRGMMTKNGSGLLLPGMTKRVSYLDNKGEKQTVEIPGCLGPVTEARQREPFIGIIPSEGLPPGTHSILAEIQPGPLPQTYKACAIETFLALGFSLPPILPE